MPRRRRIVLEMDERLGEIRARSRLRLLDGVQQAEELPLPRGGRHVIEHVVVENDEPGRVALHVGQVAQRRRHEPRVVELGDRLRSVTPWKPRCRAAPAVANWFRRDSASDSSVPCARRRSSPRAAGRRPANKRGTRRIPGRIRNPATGAARPQTHPPRSWPPGPAPRWKPACRDRGSVGALAFSRPSLTRRRRDAEKNRDQE